MANPLFFLSLSLLFLSPLSFSKPTPSTTPTTPSDAHAELNKYGFPVGLLPINVVGYAVNETSGDFFVSLGDPCKLDGIRVRAFFQWWSITGIKSNGDDLVFEVGMVTAKYPSKNFDESPQCQGKRSAS
ncbi:DUF538 family protein [Actinidia rufa]|uniref:DUF538 family protein n=1 Tax=Actinidia rufa TaxID=165716 RepID=A0A7J0FHW5_9ERIC|nr:DUF538 family protein [Actinidia rufa]